MARNRRLAQSLAGPTQVAARGSSVGGPKKGYQFVQKSGPRAGQSFNIKTGASGLNIKKYETGDTAIANSDAGVDIAAQRRDVAKTNAMQRSSVSGPDPGNYANYSQDIRQARKVNANKYLAGQLRARRGRSLGTYLR